MSKRRSFARPSPNLPYRNLNKASPDEPHTPKKQVKEEKKMPQAGVSHEKSA